jgi:hypothetical protein
MHGTGRKLVGTKNLSYWWSNRIEVKATRQNPWGRVTKFAGLTTYRNRVARNIYETYKCVGAVII